MVAYLPLQHALSLLYLLESIQQPFLRLGSDEEV